MRLMHLVYLCYTWQKAVSKNPVLGGPVIFPEKNPGWTGDKRVVEYNNVNKLRGVLVTNTENHPHVLLQCC